MERLCGLAAAVVVDRVAHRLGHLAWREHHRAAAHVRVFVVNRAGVVVVIAHADLLRAGRAQAQHDVDKTRAFVHHHMFGADDRRGHHRAVTGQNARDGTALCQGSVGRRGERQAEEFVGLVARIVEHGHGDELAGLTRREDHHAAHGSEVHARRGRDAAGAVAQRHRLGGGPVEHDGEDRHARALVHRDGVDAHIGHTRGVVIGRDGDQRFGRADERIHWRREVDVERLGRLGGGIVVDGVAHRLGRLAGRKHQRAAVVVVVVGVVALERLVGVVDRHLLRAGCAQADHDVHITLGLVGHHVFDGDHRCGDIGGVVGHDARGAHGLA